MKKKALSYEGHISPELKSYQKDQKKFASRDFDLSSLKELTKSIINSNIVYIGDFHSFDQSSRNLTRLLRGNKTIKQKITLGVEIVHEVNQEIIDQYLNRYITELEFLESINYHESWRFPWNHYKKFFDLAREEGHKIIALNSEGTLSQRDEKAAKLIYDYQQNNPEDIIVVLFGEYHIAPDKLPARVSKISNDKLTQTIIHQNIDEVYWKMAYDNIESKNQIVKFDDDEYSLQTSAPWIKYESMIYWYENILEDPDFDIHEYMIETGRMLFNSSVVDNFLYICEKISSSLKLNISNEQLEDFNLYDHQKLEIVLDKIQKVKKPTIVNFYTRLLKKSRPFRLPQSNSYYCSSYSMNRISFLAGVHIQNILLTNKDSNYEKVLLGKNQVNKFTFLFYQCMMAYFSSKLINPYRKCDLYLDMEANLKNRYTPKAKRENIGLALEIINNRIKDPQPLKEILRNVPLKQSYAASKALGYFLGDVLYSEFYKKGHEEFVSILNILLTPDYEEKNFMKLVDTLFKDVEYKKCRKRFF
jgi:hypothetical protein